MNVNLVASIGGAPKFPHCGLHEFETPALKSLPVSLALPPLKPPKIVLNICRRRRSPEGTNRLSSAGKVPRVIITLFSSCRRRQRRRRQNIVSPQQTDARVKRCVAATASSSHIIPLIQNMCFRR